MIVQKFGGAVLREPDGFRRMVRIVSDRPSSPTLVVVSAFATATRDLEFAARLAQKGLAPEAAERLDQVIADHRTLVRALLPTPGARAGMEALLDEVRQTLGAVLDGVAVTRQLTARTLDRVLASGEFLALHIARHVLQEAGIDVVGVDAESVVVTTSDHGAARPLPEKTAVRVRQTLAPALAAHAVVLVQGFVGRSEDGATTTMGKESSNLTATLLGSLLEATEVVIYTDTEGVRSADPHQCDGTHVRAHLTYDEARTAARNGLKLLYPTMIEPAERSAVRIRIVHAAAPQGQSTVIDGEGGDACAPIVIVTDVNGMAEVRTVFVDTSAWLRAAADVVGRMQSGTPCDVHTDHAERTAVLRVPSHLASAVGTLLHATLFTTDRTP
jgi:aspartate kinase